MADELLDTVNFYASTPNFSAPPLFSSNTRKSAGVTDVVSARNIRINDYRWGLRSTASNGIFVKSNFPFKPSANSFFLLLKSAKTDSISIYIDNGNPYTVSLDKFNTRIARGVSAIHSAIDCVYTVCNNAKIHAPIVQTVTVPMVYNSTAGTHNHIVHVKHLFHPTHSTYTTRRIKSFGFRIPTGIPPKLRQFFKISFVNKSKLPLCQRYTAIWEGFRQLFKISTEVNG